MTNSPLSSQLASARLYGILDTGYTAPEKMRETLAKMLLGGIDIVQLRAKGFTAEQLLPLVEPLFHQCDEAGVPFMINDFPELGHLADGVHVGQMDSSILNVRQQLRLGGIVGKSTHSLAQAKMAKEEGADYIGFGPLYPTPTKEGRPAIGLEEIAETHRQVTIPIFCIGGIKRELLPAVIAAGARRVVIVSGILQAIDIPGYISDCKALLTETSL